MSTPILYAITAVILVLAALFAAALAALFLRTTRGASGLRARILALFASASRRAPNAAASHYYRPYWARR
jgi:hypothetical protein